MALPGIRIFRLFGIDVYLHWAWAIVAFFVVQRRVDMYESPVWAALEVLSLFAIVLIHEFGHALACRSVGGQAEHIMLWPLGGVAFVNPPFRPGAHLWSTVAGPLVNVVLLGPTIAATMLYSNTSTGASFNPDVDQFLHSLAVINVVLLVFNMLPVYPLDGGRIFREIMWFFIGPSRSLQIACYVGLVGIALLAGYALYRQDVFLIVILFFAASQCKRGLDEAKELKYLEPVKRARQPEMVSCPSCGQPPPLGPFWQCECGNAIDVISENGHCPHCTKLHLTVACPRCNQAAHLFDWRNPPSA